MLTVSEKMRYGMTVTQEEIKEELAELEEFRSLFGSIEEAIKSKEEEEER
jgi:hypothetical protein